MDKDDELIALMEEIRGYNRETPPEDKNYLQGLLNLFIKLIITEAAHIVNIEKEIAEIREMLEKREK
jgi:hypothetical protein